MSGNPQYLTLGIGPERFGLAIGHVREILDMRPVSRLPHAPAFLLGMIDVRGASFAVVDLRCKLGLPRAEPTDSTRIIIVSVALADRTLGIGLVADRVEEVTGLENETLEPPPEIGARWDRSCIAGIGRRNGGFVIILDVGALMGTDSALLPGSPAERDPGSVAPEMTVRAA